MHGKQEAWGLVFEAREGRMLSGAAFLPRARKTRQQEVGAGSVFLSGAPVGTLQGPVHHLQVFPGSGIPGPAQRRPLEPSAIVTDKTKHPHPFQILLEGFLCQMKPTGRLAPCPRGELESKPGNLVNFFLFIKDLKVRIDCQAISRRTARV